MADILGKDLDNVDDSLVVRQPFDIESSEISGPQFMTGSDFVRSAKIDSSWKEPIATFAQARSETSKGKQFVMSTAQSLSDTLANLPSNVSNLYAQLTMAENRHPILSTLSKFADRSGWKEVKTALDNTIDLLNEREYPETKWAQRVIANTTNDVETRKMVRALYNQSQGIDSEKWYNQTGSIIGAMIPAMAVGNVAFSGARAFGAGRVAATRLAENITKGYIGAEMAGQYAEETAAKYLERTGDKTFSNFTPKDATGLSALAYGAIGAQIEFMGGVEPIMAGALSKVGLRTGLLKAGIKIAGGEATEEFLQGITEGLMRKIDNTSDKTWGDVLKESLNSAMWGAFIGGMTGSTAFYTARRNLVKGIKTALPNISNEQAKLVADSMIDTTGEISSQDPTLRDNLRKKIDLMYKGIDIENKADRIDAMTDLEYSLIVMDANERGIDLAEHELFSGVVNELGWFRAGIPEERRIEIQEINDNIADLKTQLAELNEAKEKDWEKIEEIENKLKQANQYVLEKLSDMARDDGAAVRRILKGLENKYVVKEKEKATKQAIKSGNVDAIRDVLSKAGFRTRDLSGTQVKELAKLNWQLLQDQDLGIAQSRGTKQVPLTAIEQNVESGNTVLLRAGYTQDQIDKMDDETWNRAVLTQYRKEAPKTVEYEYTEEDLPDMPLLQEQFDIADENARLDDIYPEYTGETINIDGKERTVYNSNGERIAKSAEALTNFWRWFGDSKVVDEQGRPLVVYHGTDAEFDIFDKNITPKRKNLLGQGFYFTNQQNKAKWFGKNIMPVYLKIENPETNAKIFPDIEKLKQSGKDGIIKDQTYILESEPITYVAFEPTQIKSVNNRGTFSEKTGNIYWQETEDVSVRPETARINYLESNLAEWQKFLDDTIANNTNNWNAEILEDNRKRAKKAISNIKKEIKELQESLKEPIEEKLYATHNMSLAGVKGALKLGGLAMPSLAIRKVSQGNINQFGDIVFVGGTKLVEPSKTTEVYDRDAWTPSLAYNMKYELTKNGKKFITDILNKHKSDHSASVFLYNIEQNIDTPKSNPMAMQLYCLDRGIDYDSVSHYELSNSLDYLTWYEENITGNSEPYLWAENADNTDMKKYKYTLDNMIRILKRQERSGGGFIGDTVLTTGHLLQFMANKYKNLQEIKANKNKLVSREEQTKAISEIDEAFYQLADELKLDGKTYEHYENRTGLAIAAINNESEIKANLDRYNLDSSDESVEKVKQFTQKMKDVVTDYFEVKPRRIVDFNEFSGVIVPNGAEYDDVASKLENSGMFVQRVEKGNESAYKDALMEIQRRYKTVLFQNKVSGAAPSTYRGAYIPQYRFILRANKMDASTLSHEMAHDWFEVNFDRYRSGKATPEFMRAWGALEKALGVPENATETPRQASEAFARGYEAWIMQNQEWAKLINVEDKDKDSVEKLMKDYQNDLRDIYNDISNPYFKQTWGKLAELKPELKAWFDRVVNITDLDVLVERGEITESQAQAEKLNRAIDNVIENTEDAETAQTLKEIRTLNDTSRYEVEGGNKNSLQERLSVLAKEIDENNMLVKGEKYDTRRDMMQVAKDADNFVKTRLDDALAIINGQMAEVEGLYREDIYTALERLAVENGDLNLLDELKNSEIANRLAKELGQRVAGFRNWKQSTDIDVVSALKSLDNKFNKALENKKAQKEFNTALSMLDAELKVQDTIADKELESTLKELECQ